MVASTPSNVSGGTSAQPPTTRTGAATVPPRTGVTLLQLLSPMAKSGEGAGNAEQAALGTDAMVVVEGRLGMGKSILAVDMQNQWPLLPVMVVTASEHDRRCAVSVCMPECVCCMHMCVAVFINAGAFHVGRTSDKNYLLQQ